MHVQELLFLTAVAQAAYIVASVSLVTNIEEQTFPIYTYLVAPLFARVIRFIIEGT